MNQQQKHRLSPINTLPIKKIRISSTIFDDDDDNDEDGDQKDKKEEKFNEVIVTKDDNVFIPSSNSSTNQRRNEFKESTNSVGNTEIEEVEINERGKLLKLIHESFEKIRLVQERIKTDIQSFTNFPNAIGCLLDEIFEFTFSLKFKSLFTYHFGYLYLACCLLLLNLHNSNTLSDDNFFHLVETYANDEKRSYQSITLFIIGVVLQRIRILQSPASRIVMKSFEICSNCCKDIFNFLLVQIITQPSHIIESIQNTIPGSQKKDFLRDMVINAYQFEFVQRILRQVT